MAELSMPFRRTIQMIVKRCSCDNCGWQKISKERKVHFCRNCSNARHFNTMNKKIGMQEVLINIIHCCHCGIIFVWTRMWLCRDLTEKLDDAGFRSRSQPVSSLSLLLLLLLLTETPDNAGSQSQFQPVSWLALWLSLLLSLLLTLIEILDKAASQSRSRPISSLLHLWRIPWNPTLWQYIEDKVENRAKLGAKICGELLFVLQCFHPSRPDPDYLDPAGTQSVYCCGQHPFYVVD